MDFLSLLFLSAVLNYSCHCHKTTLETINSIEGEKGGEEGKQTK
jgi:hypothetical protein